VGIFKTYINPFDVDGTYTSFTEVTKDTIRASLTDISQDVDSSDYELGVFRFANIQLRFNNKSGRFSDIETFQSIFRYRRSDSQVKITYRIQDGPQCGTVKCGMVEAKLAAEVVLFKGLVNDESYSTDVKQQNVQVRVLGFESLLSRVTVPFASLSNGMLVSTAIYAMLNQTPLNDLMNIELANIVPDLDQAIDSVASFQNKTVKEAMDKLLLASNSVLYVDKERAFGDIFVNDTVYVKSRAATIAVQAQFFGQASNEGAENIVNIANLKNGVSRVFNYVTWRGTTLLKTDSDSVTRYGVRKVELDLAFFTDNTKRNNILQAVVDEFSTAKQEFQITVPLTYASLDLTILDRISVDYPTVYIAGENEIPICGVFLWEVGVLPEALWTLTIDSADGYKIIGKKINVQNQTIAFKVRKI